ncbi:MAG: hypothetical protein ACLRPW_10170 [Intestinibacter sp.]
MTGLLLWDLEEASNQFDLVGNYISYFAGPATGAFVLARCI